MDQIDPDEKIKSYNSKKMVIDLESSSDNNLEFMKKTKVR